MNFLGIDWVGVNADKGRKLLLSVIFIAVLLGASWALRGLAGLLVGHSKSATVQTRFWIRQGISLLTAIVLVLGILSIWFSDPTRLATALGLVSAGLAFALQQVVTSIAGYFVILRGNSGAPHAVEARLPEVNATEPPIAPHDLAEGIWLQHACSG